AKTVLISGGARGIGKATALAMAAAGWQVAFSYRADGEAAAETLAEIVQVHFPDIKERLLGNAMTRFFELRETPGLKKKPSTSEMLDWLRLLVADDLDPETLRADAKTTLPPLHGALLKNEQDIHLFERLAFMARRERR
ncbi:MAG: SDR family NAD(P)-dependent oxidoreductase, partial [Pseudomonadota bacterium]